MNLYSFYFIIIYLPVCISLNYDMKISKSELEEVNPCAVGLKFFVEVNNTGSVDYDTEVSGNECCLLMQRNEQPDCASLEIFGGNAGVIPKGSTKSFTLVAPLLEPYGRVGYCSLFLDSTVNGQKRIQRIKYNIKFDTNIKSDVKVQNRTGIRKCNHIDEDPLNNCMPVNCESYYNGKRPYYNLNLKRCVKVPTCVTKSSIEDTLIIYNQDSNKCSKSKRIEIEDLDQLKNGDYKNEFNNIIVLKKKDKQIPKKTNTCVDDDTDDCERREKEKKKEKKKKTKLLAKAKKKIFSCGWTFWLTVIISIQCCLICIMVYFLTCRLKTWKHSKNYINAYYNYKHDPTITTPLISTTSNMETDTTDFKYSTQSSILERNKHYKTIQNDKDDIKKSMSDDILSKCINRRDWIRKTNDNDYITYTERSIQDTIERQNEETQYQANLSRVNFENETRKPKKVTVVSNSKGNESNYSINRDNSKNSNDSEKMEHLMSEKEIKCTSYSYTSKPNLTGFQPSMQKKNFAFIKTERFDAEPNTQTIKTEPKSLIHHRKHKLNNRNFNNIDQNFNQAKLASKCENSQTPHIEKSAQAYFSNDSIDDFLSERGMKFLTGENISKYSFSTDTIPINESTISNTISNKTSKNNIVKRVLSLIRKPKLSPSSDPGRSRKDYDVQILHMSNASLYSSSNDRSNCIVSNKFFEPKG